MPADEARFVSLAELIRSRPLMVEAAAPGVSPPAGPAGTEFSSPSSAPATVPETRAEALSGRRPPVLRDGAESVAAAREARLFRAALADAFDALAAQLVRALAADVLGRELQLAPADVELLARRLVTDRRADEPLSLRVCPADLPVDCELPVVGDPELQPGDVVLVCCNGEIDARLAVRLADVLAAVGP